MAFRLTVNYTPKGDQAAAIDELLRGIRDGEQHQVLLGVTGSGKTFTMAKVIERLNRTTLVLAHNKTLAAQLYHEFEATSRKTLSSILSVTTIITNRRRTSLRRIPTLKRNPRSTTRSTGCASRLRDRCSSGAMSLSWRRSPASTVWGLRKPITGCCSCWKK